MNNPSVAIIILNWNGWSDTIECIESVFQINYPNFNVLLIDNNSSDDSNEKIKDYAEGQLNVISKFFNYNPNNKPIEISTYINKKSQSQNYLHHNKNLILIKNEMNYGFAEGNNIGIRFALKNLNPDYILLLNNDTVVDKNFLAEMINMGENNKEIGILGPKIYYYNKPNEIWSVGAKISWKTCRGIHIGINEIDNGQYKEKTEVEYVSGSAFLIKTEVIRKIGLLDKEFF